MSDCERRRIYEGYIYVIPYAGDGYILCNSRIEGFSNMRPRDRFLAKIEKMKNSDVITIDDILKDLENKKVRITVEVLDE